MISTSCGDTGDCVYLLCVLKHIKGAPHALLIEEKSPHTASARDKEAATKLTDFIKSLVELQPYISECRLMEPWDAPEWRSGDFRPAGMHERTPTLLYAHLAHFNSVSRANLKINVQEPWLTVEASEGMKGMVVINRTVRYQNRHFQWKKIVEHYQGRIVFVGLQHEWKGFCDEFGYVSFRETKTLLDVAKIIAGCALFIGNQSCPYALAEGLKQNSIQETSTSMPDCVFPRPNAQFVADGACKLPDVSGSGELIVQSNTFKPNYNAQISLQPKYGWSYKGFSSATYKGLLTMAMRELGMSKEDAHRGIIEELYSREPDYFGPNHEEMELFMVRQAISGGDGWRKGAREKFEAGI